MFFSKELTQWKTKIGHFYFNLFLIKESMSAKQILLNVDTGNLTKFKKNENYMEEYGYRDNLEFVVEKILKVSLIV